LKHLAQISPITYNTFQAESTKELKLGVLLPQSLMTQISSRIYKRIETF